MNRSAAIWAVLGAFGFAVLPWHLADGLLAGLLFRSGLVLALGPERPWLLPLVIPVALSLWAALGRRDPAAYFRVFIWAGIAGLAWLCLSGFAINHKGIAWSWLSSLLGGYEARQDGMGAGAALLALSFLFALCHGLAYRGWCRGDVFTVSAIGLIVALTILFVAFPVARILASAVQDNAGNFAPGLLVDKISDQSIWGIACVTSNLRCGVAWNTLFLALCVAIASTGLGLAFALITLRTGFPFKRVLQALTVLPIITPPFVIGVAIILLFGRSGVVSTFLFENFDVPRSRWIYGFWGVFLAQLLAFAPIAFLVLLGVVQGISPSLEEASQTLRARSWTTFSRISLPLMRPGLANAFLLSFVESLADFGNPLVLGGNFEVLSTKIFFAVVGASHDQGRAAVLALVLLLFTFAVFWAQSRWLGRSSYTTLTGKGDSGLPLPLPARVSWFCYLTALPWGLFTVAIYFTIFLGSVVKALGRDHTFTLEYFKTGFAIEQAASGLRFAGSAWNSFWTTIQVSAISAPLTAMLGLLTAYLLTRQRFAGKRALEFGTMLSFAIPGTVVGISYILAFNVPPVELTGTGTILVICFMFRNMPVGVRAGIAALSQVDKSLDEASLTLGARSFTTLRRIILPLLRPAVVAAMVYSFVRAMTSVSAVIFLVTAEYNMATAYIVGRVEAGEFGLAIAYSAVLIVVMLAAVLGIQLLVGNRRLGRRQGGQIALQGAG